MKSSLSKWSSLESRGGTILQNLNKDLSRLKSDESIVEETNSETQRLHESCDELFDENFNSFSVNYWKLYKGIAFSSLSSVFFSFSSVIVKYLDDIDPGELAVFRFVGIFLLTLPLLLKNGTNPFGPQELRHFLVLRGICGATSLLLRFHAFRYLPIADASVIIFSVPVFVSFFACIFLKETCGLFQSLTVLLTMIGLALTTKLPFLFGSELHVNSTQLLALNHTLSVSHEQLAVNERLHHIYGVLSAFTSTLFASFVFIFIRKAKGAHHSIIMFNFGWIAILETVIITALFNGFSIPKTLFSWTLILLLGVFSFCGQILLTRSLQLEQAGPVSVVRAATDIALAFVFQLWLFEDIPDIWSLCGAFLVTTSILLTSVRKWVLSLPDHSRIKNRFYFLIF